MFWLAWYNNLLLTKRESRTGEYWPEVVAVRTKRSEVRTKTTEGLELARLASSLLYALGPCLFWKFRLSKTKNTQPVTVSTEVIYMAKSRPRKNQSERSDLPQDWPCHIKKSGYSGFLCSGFIWSSPIQFYAKIRPLRTYCLKVSFNISCESLVAHQDYEEFPFLVKWLLVVSSSLHKQKNRTHGSFTWASLLCLLSFSTQTKNRHLITLSFLVFYAHSITASKTHHAYAFLLWLKCQC